MLVYFLLLLQIKIGISQIVGDNDFVQIGQFQLTDGQSTIQVTFASALSSIPQIVISTFDFECDKNISELDYHITLSNISQSGFTATLTDSANTLAVVQLSYTATVLHNIFSFAPSALVSAMQHSSDLTYNTFSLIIPYSNKALIDTPGTLVKVFGYLTGFRSQIIQTSLSELIVSTFFQINQSPDKYSFTVNVSELIKQQGQLQEVRFNYLEYYYNENSAHLIEIYQEKSYEIISDLSNCLIKYDQASYASLPAICNSILSADQKSTYHGRVQSIPNSISVKHSTKNDFTIGLSKLEMDISVENGRLTYFSYDTSSIPLSLQLIYYTWQGTKILGVTSTIVEYYNVACPTSQFYSFATHACVSSCPSSTYPESNSTNNLLLPTCMSCFTSCLECSGSLSTNCLSCSSSFPYLNKSTNQCMSSPPSDSYFCVLTTSASDPSYQYNCSPCIDNLCIKCNSPNINSCLQCNPVAYLYNLTCSLSKPANSLCNSQKVCQVCTLPYCLDCFSQNMCNKCPLTFYLDPTTLKCLCPYGTYLDTAASQCSNCIINCATCLDSNTCIECSYNAIPDPAYPGKCIKSCAVGTYFDRLTNKCIQCDVNCASCANSSTNCTTCQTGAVIQQNTTTLLYHCACKNANDIYNQNYGTCQPCDDEKCTVCTSTDRSDCQTCIASSVLLVNQTNRKGGCQCKDSTYYSHDQASCIPCAIQNQNCAVCSVDGLTCSQCMPGYYLNPSLSSCSYCGQGKYANPTNQCILDCPSNCDLCSSSLKCDKFKDGAIFEGNICYFSCSKCLGSNYNQCVECSSTTREYNSNDKTCNCKSSYRETESQDCQYNPDSSLIFQIASVSTTAQYFAYLPTVLTNIHPFSDYFIINSQLLGDYYYAKDTNFVGIFVSHFAKFNYFNLFDQDVSVVRSSLPGRENSSKLVNIIPFFAFAFICYLFIAMTFVISKINRLKSTKGKSNSEIKDVNSIEDIQPSFNIEANIIVNANKNGSSSSSTRENMKNYLNWNLFIKVHRITSNLIMMYCVNNYDQIFVSVNFYSISIVVYAIFYLIYLGGAIYMIRYPSNSPSSLFLTTNLKTTFILHRSLWLIIEIKKIAFCTLFILKSTYSLWAQFSLCVLTLFILIFSKPCDTKRRDCLYLILSEFVLTMIIINLLILKANASQINSLQDLLQQSMELINIIQLFQIVFSILHTIITIEYLFRVYYQAKQEKALNSNTNMANNNFIENEIKQQGLTFHKIHSILQQRSFSISLHERRTFQKSLL